MRRCSGSESIHVAGTPLDFDLQSFWRWSASNLVSNATRGVLAEYLVARALGADVDGIRDEWAAFDLTTPAGVTVEVKSAAYVQCWHQHRPTPPRFSIRPSSAWDASTGTYADGVRRQADVYVFALLAHRDKATIDPLDVTQWTFFVVPTAKLNARLRDQKTVGLSVVARTGSRSSFAELATTFLEVVRQARGE